MSDVTVSELSDFETLECDEKRVVRKCLYLTAKGDETYLIREGFNV